MNVLPRGDVGLCSVNGTLFSLVLSEANRLVLLVLSVFFFWGGG